MEEKQTKKKRPKYKQLWKDARNDYADCRMELDDCHKWIIEAARILKENGLSEELDRILNYQYGATLFSSISKIDFNYKWKPSKIFFGEEISSDGICKVFF